MNLGQAEKQIKKTIGKFINPKDYKIFIFGSRAKEKARKFSDYDIGIMGKRPLSFEKMALIEDALEESDLPFRVDLIDFHSVTKEFKKSVAAKIKII